MIQTRLAGLPSVVPVNSIVLFNPWISVMSALKLDCLLYHIFTISSVLVSGYNAELKNTVTIDEHLHEVVDSPLAQAGPLLKEEFDPTERLLDRNVDRNFSVEFAVYRPRLSGGQYVFEVAYVSSMISIPGSVALKSLVVVAM